MAKKQKSPEEPTRLLDLATLYDGLNSLVQHFAGKFLSNLTLAGIYQKKMFELYSLLTVKYPVKLVAMASNVSSCTLDII